jgi:hypothetical protein
MIEFVSCNLSGEILNVPRRSGMALCSTRDPRREAQRWIKAIQALRVEQIFVIGLGAGYHIEELAKVYSGQINVIEIDQELIDHWLSKSSVANIKIAKFTSSNTNFTEWVASCSRNANLIFDFRPAWAGAEETFGLVRDVLTCRTSAAINTYFNEGMSALACHVLPTDRLISAKEIVEYSQAAGSDKDLKTWKLLSELLK